MSEHDQPTPAGDQPPPVPPRDAQEERDALLGNLPEPRLAEVHRHWLEAGGVASGAVEEASDDFLGALRQGADKVALVASEAAGLAPLMDKAAVATDFAEAADTFVGTPDSGSIIPEKMGAKSDAGSTNPALSVGVESVELQPVSRSEGRASETLSTPTQRDANLATPTERELEAGLVLGAYKLVKKLGQGGMGMVFLAEHQRMERLVALKVLPPSVTKNHNAVERFHREVKAMARLSHPHIVTAYDADEARGLHFLVMEYVDGQDLAALVKKRGPLSVEHAVDYIVQGAKGLEYAHKRGLVHRDIKPSNFLVDTEGQVKILDLGLARFSEQTDDGDGPPGMDLTGTGVVVGTVDYMSPEQAEDTKRADARADIYSLGCSLFYLISGRSMFGGDTVVARLLAHQNQPVPSLRSINPAVPEELERIHRKMVAKKKEERYQTATALLDDLRKLAPEAFAGQGPRFAPDAARPANNDQTLVGPLSGSVTGGSTEFGSSAPATASLSTAAGAVRPPVNKKLVIGAAAAALALLMGWVIIFRDKDGKEVGRVEGTGPVVAKTQDGTSAEFRTTEEGIKPVTASSAGSPSTGWHGWPADAPKPAIAPFDAAQAKKHQEEWAAYLKVPVEYTNSIGMKFRLIPPGEFLMGSTPEEIAGALKHVGELEHWKQCVKSEAPKHSVVLTQPIYMGVHEVNQVEYEKVVGTNPSHFTSTGMGKAAVTGLDTTRFPVDSVNWNDAAEFCAKLSQRENLKPSYFRAGETVTPLDGSGYRLPREAEWEFACRAGTVTRYWSGDSDEDQTRISWIRENAGERTHATGELKANPYGLFDVQGNVWEWVQDGWDASYFARFQSRPAVNPDGPLPAGQYRLIRGGDWFNSVSYTRSAARIASLQIGRGYDIGFRVSLSVAAVQAANNIPNGAERALAFDGVDDHMEIPRLMLRKEKPITVEAWLTPQTWKHSAIINISGKRPVSLYLNEGTVGFWCLGSKIEMPAPATLVGQRIHVAGVYDEKDLTVYLNGQPSAKIKPLVPEGGEPLMAIVGAIRDWENNFLTLRGFFHGQLHAIRVSETVRYTAEFNPPTELGSDAETLACYQFQAGHGDTVRDLSSHQFDGRVIGARWVADNRRSITGWPADAPKPAIAPFDAAQAKTHQEEWAAYLKVPVEYTNSIGMKLSLVPPGEFLMGSSPEEIEAAFKDVDPNDKNWQDFVKSEAPQHKVILTQPIYVGTHEVTQSEYQKVTGLNPSHFAPTGAGKDAVAGLKTATHPVEMVSWFDSAEFCSKLSQQEKLKPFYRREGESLSPLEGNGYRLPSEAEWEFACRAGTVTKRWIGDKDEDLPRAGWFAGNSGGRTHAVGELKANPFGLFDVQGNVWEWVQDLWDTNTYSQSQDKPAINPSTPVVGGYPRVFRGGSFPDIAPLFRSSVRFINPPVIRDKNFGFRVTLSVDAVKASLAERSPPVTSSTSPWHGWPAGAPQPAIAPFDAAQAKARQEAWAAYLKVPAEYTNALGMKFRLIPPGQFVMGSSPEEIDATIAIIEGDEKAWKDRVRSEGPRHPVTITRPYYLGVTEVTQGEYEKIIGKNPAHFSAKGAGRKIVKDADTSRQPVETINWHEALEFCNKLAAADKLTLTPPKPGEPAGRAWSGPYSLPTEAEWEFAARSGTTTSHWTGPDLAQLGRTAWYIDHGDFNPYRTYPGGQLEANPLGLCDMYGNVWEWTLDGYEQNHFQKLVGGVIDPTGPNPPGNQRVQRGGAGGLHAMHCRSSNRGAVPADMKVNGWGFRVALSVDAVREKLQQATVTTALGFDGTGARVEIPDLKWDPTKPLTLEAWCLPAKPVGQGLVAGFGGECELRLRGRHWWFGVKGADGNWREVVATADASFKVPAHIAGVWNGTEIRLFFDGVRHGDPVPCPAPAPKGTAATLGSALDGSQGFAGRMLQVRVSTSARYVDDFDPAPVLEKDGDTAALYRFDTDTGGTVPDLSGNNRTGTLREARWTSAPRVPGAGSGQPVSGVRVPPATPEARLKAYLDANRRAAERALAVGGPGADLYLQYIDRLDYCIVKPGEPLPDEPFVVRNWSIKNSTTATNADLDPLTALRHVRNLSLLTAGKLDKSSLTRVAAMKTPLEEFAIAHSAIKTSDLESLPPMSTVHKLDVTSEQVDDQWRSLQKFPNLVTLSLHGNPLPDLEPLGEFKSLRTFQLSGCPPLSDEQIRRLQERNPRLRLWWDETSVGTNVRVLGTDPARAAAKRLLAAGAEIRASTADGKAHTPSASDLDGLVAWNLWCERIPADLVWTDALSEDLSQVILFNFTCAGVKSADPLAAALGNRHELHNLYLQESDLTDAGLKRLESLTGLAFINLTGTRVTAAGIAAFHRAVPACYIAHESFPTLADFLAEPEAANAVGAVDQTATWILERGGQVMVAGRDGWIAQVADLPPTPFQVRMVKFSKALVEEDRDLVPLRGLTGLEFVGLDFTGANVAAFEGLANHPRLERLSCGAMELTDAHMEAIVGISSLTRLYAANSGVTAARLRILEPAAARMETFNLSNTASLDDSAVEVLTRFKGLGNLQIDDTRITAAGVERLRKELPGCAIQWNGKPAPSPRAALDTFLSKFFEDGGKAEFSKPGSEVRVTVAAGEPIPARDHVLRGLMFGDLVPATDKDLAALLAAGPELRGMKSLVFRFAPELTETSLAVLDATPELELLVLPRGTGLGRATFDRVARLTRLVSLETTTEGITLDLLRTLGGLSALRHLDTRIVCGPEAAEFLATFPKLNSLAVSSVEPSDAVFENLAKVTGLKALNLTTPVGSEVVSKLAKARAEWLQLIVHDPLGGETWKALAGTGTLKTLVVNHKAGAEPSGEVLESVRKAIPEVKLVAIP